MLRSKACLGLPGVKETPEIRGALDKAAWIDENPRHPTGRARRDAGAAEGVAPANSQAKGPIGSGSDAPDSGERRRAARPGGATEGARSPRCSGRNLSGTKDRGVRQAPRACLTPFSFRRPRELARRPRPSTPCTAPRARAWSISAAGTCRCTTARRSRSTTRCAATRACSTSRTCCVVDVDGAGARDVPAPRARQRRRQARRPGQGALLLHAQRRGRRDRRPHRLFLPRGLLPPGGERRHRARRTSPGCEALRARWKPRSRIDAAARPRDDRGPGPAARASASGRRFPRRAPPPQRSRRFSAR